MKTKTKEVTTTRTVTYVEIGGHEFEAYYVKEILEGLADTDPYFNRMVMHNDRLEKALDAAGVIWKSVRGSVAKGKNYEAFVKEFEEATGYEVEID